MQNHKNKKKQRKKKETKKDKPKSKDKTGTRKCMTTTKQAARSSAVN